MINEERNEELFDALIKVPISNALKNEMDALPSNEELNKYFKSSKELNKRIEKLIM